MTGKERLEKTRDRGRLRVGNRAKRQRKIDIGREEEKEIEEVNKE